MALRPSRPQQSLLLGTVIATGVFTLVGRSVWKNIRSMRPDLQTTPLNPYVPKPSIKFYDGGFESIMSSREASLILGCRETSSRERITERYRTLMKANHPDLGGSPYLSSKINEAKELLMKTARSEEEKR